MKFIYITFLLSILAVCQFACVIQPKIQYYDQPEGIAEEARLLSLKKIEKGRLLYNINCAKCHNTKENGRIVFPDFTSEQLESYTIRIKNETHVTSLAESKITAEELEDIQLFFTYKKPGRPVSGN